MTFFLNPAEVPDELAAAWAALHRGYYAARAAEQEHDRLHIDSVCPPNLPVGPERDAALNLIPAHIWKESEELTERRYPFEDGLLALPSPHVAAFALKVLICRGEDRDLNGMDDALAAEAEAILRAFAASTTGEAA